MIENISDIKFTQHLNQTITRSFDLERRSGNQAAMFTLNLTFNDLDNVDELLEGITERIRQRLRGTDIVLQLDGYEIALLLKDICSQDNADTVINELVEVITQPIGSIYSTNVNIHSGANTKVKISFSLTNTRANQPI